MYHPIRMSSAPTRQDPFWTLEIDPWSGRDSSNTSLQLGELARLLAQPRGVRTASGGKDTPWVACACHGRVVRPRETCGSAYLSANFRPQEHAYRSSNCVATRDKHVMAMPSPRPIHEEKGSGLRLDWDVIDADADLRPSSQTLPPSYCISRVRLARRTLVSPRPFFLSLLPLPYREDLRLDGIADDTPVYTRSVRSP